LALASLAKPVQAQAESETFHVQDPFEFLIVNPCTGEEVLVNGTFSALVHVTEDPNGGTHFKIYTSFWGRGVSASGAKYVVKGHEQSHHITNIGGDSAFENTTPILTKYIRQGETPPNDDFEAKVLFHTTINANGEITSEVVKVEEHGCK